MKNILIFLAAVLPAFSQVGSSTITGRITDATNSAIAAAQVKIVNQESGTSVTVASNEEGIFRAGSLIPGSYRIEVQASGFDAAVRNNVTLEVAQTFASDFALQVGQHNQ